MDLDLVFLGTSGSMPTAKRAPTALLVRRGGERLLFDCAEGTQRQLLRSNVGLVELRPGDVLERGDYRLATFPVAHGVSALGYSLVEEPRPGRFDVEAADTLGVPSGPERGTLQGGDPITLPDGRTIPPDAVLGPPRPGRKVVITGDTAPAREIVEIARGADLLVHEATFCEDEAERAHETAHSTAKEAAQVALLHEQLVQLVHSARLDVAQLVVARGELPEVALTVRR